MRHPLKSWRLMMRLAMLHKIEDEENGKEEVKEIDAGKQGFAEGRARNGK